MSRRSVEDWRRQVYRATVVGGRVQVLLLLMADHMRADRKVSIPRARLAAYLDITERRVSERIKVAIEHGYLDKVGGGYRGRTAEYQALFPAERVTPTSTLSSTETRTLSPLERVTDGGYPITTADLSARGADRDVGSNEDEACRWHGFEACPEDCADHPSSRRRTA